MNPWTVADIPRQDGKVAVVTGANSGIGWYTALDLARSGAEVILTARTEEKGRDAVDGIVRQIPDAKVRYELLDLASLASVKRFASKIGSSKVDLLVNNAGVMAIPKREVTQDGFERQMATNYLGPFALTGLLMPALMRSKSPRVTTVSSGAANQGLKRINFEDLQWEKNYGAWRAYSQSKLADLMFAIELGVRCKATGSKLLSNASHPGVARSNLQKSGPGDSLLGRIFSFLQFMAQSTSDGALPSLRAATEPDAAQGSYYGPSNWFGARGPPVLVSIPKPAQDEAARKRLWEVSEKLTGVTWSPLLLTAT
jgi:NAD(P)-dependent dehydrogenase (short-subunit alcohol dehydrogenase family)